MPHQKRGRTQVSLQQKSNSLRQWRDARKESAMNRWLLIGSLAGLLIASTGCLHHNTRGGCSTGGCETSACGSGCNSCGNSSGMLGRMAGLCGTSGCRAGCSPGKIGWMQGGHNYSAHLQPGHGVAQGINRPHIPGPPSAQVGYPYYSHRGPRDFLLDNPPTIGR